MTGLHPVTLAKMSHARFLFLQHCFDSQVPLAVWRVSVWFSGISMCASGWRFEFCAQRNSYMAIRPLAEKSSRGHGLKADPVLWPSVHSHMSVSKENKMGYVKTLLQEEFVQMAKPHFKAMVWDNTDQFAVDADPCLCIFVPVFSFNWFYNRSHVIG